MDTLTALNLSALFQPVPTSSLDSNHTYVASRIVPFGTIFQVQVRLLFLLYTPPLFLTSSSPSFALR